MSIRPPKASRPTRNSARWRENAVVGLTALALVAFGLRAVLALIDIQSWTIAWRVVSALTSVFIVPLEQWSPMNRTLAGNLTVADALAVLIVAVVSIIVLSSLANQRVSQRLSR